VFATVVADRGLFIIERPGLMVTATVRSPDDDAYRAITRYQLELARRDGRVSLLGVVPTFDGPMRATSAVRRECEQLVAAERARFLGMAVAITVDGITGMLLRTAIAAMQFRSAIPRSSTARTLEEAVHELQSWPGQRDELSNDVGLAASVVTALKPHGVVLG